MEAFFQPLIEQFKQQHISKYPDEKYSSLVDVYSRWYQNYFYLCGKYVTGDLHPLKEGMEEKSVRIKYTGKNQFDFSYFRHTGQWHLVAEGPGLDGCKEMILSNPVFHPIG